MSRRSEPAWIPQGLLDAARKRTASVVSRLRQAMRDIERDIDVNDGLYPYNKGRVDQSEVCRRAGVSKVTLQGAIHKTTTKKEVDDWVAAIKERRVRGAQSVRRQVTERAEAWKAAHGLIANQYHLAELELVEARQRIKQLEEEMESLRGQLAKKKRGTVVPFVQKPKG